MQRILFGLVFMGCYLAWVLYRLVVKKDIKQHKTEFFAYSFFVSAWVVIYTSLFL